MGLARQNVHVVQDLAVGVSQTLVIAHPSAILSILQLRIIVDVGLFTDHDSLGDLL